MAPTHFSLNTLVVLTTAPTGLGHTRVTEALRQGLAPGTRIEILGSKDWSMQALHRVSSVNPAMRALMELVQNNPAAEGGFTRWYRQVLRYNPQTVLRLVKELVLGQTAPVKNLILVCTHFGLAHQMGAVKEELGEQLGVKVKLAVVVTDDSPQQIWAVPGADLILVPSESTRAGLEEVFGRMEGSCPKLAVVPYPVSPNLGKRMTAARIENRQRQCRPDSKLPLKLMIPVSGAAVMLDFFKELILTLGQLMRVEFIVVARESAATAGFLGWCRSQDKVQILAARADREVVELYERAYAEQVIGVEVTKPSEQAFKALLKPEQVGGSLLMLTEPVGRQEEDNLHFLNRHHLCPDLKDLQVLAGGRPVAGDLLKRAGSWRAVAMPEGAGGRTAIMIHRLKQQGVLGAMADFSGFRGGHEELSSDGVAKVWDEINML